MNEIQAKELVIKAGLELVRTGLIVRTWGNVSCRIDESRFAITPSGMAYERLTPEDIVICSVADASYSGSVKPSSEKGVHALVYRSREDVGFVIHTHQKYASAVSASAIQVLHGEDTIGDVPVAVYGLPGTKKLMRGVSDVLPQAKNSVLMAHHGALCFGSDFEATFTAAHALEESSKRSVHEVLNIKPEEVSVNGINEELKTAIFKVRKDIRHIECSNDPYIMAAIASGASIPTLLDDFAQIVGRSVRIASEVGEVVQKLKGRQCVLIPDVGALCCAATESDAHTVCLVTEKNALAFAYASALGKPKPIAAWECMLMRLNYQKNYSKKI